MNVVMLSLVSICVLFTPWLRRRGGGEGEGCACLESERRERGHREAGRDRRGPVRVVGRRHGRGRPLAAGITGVQGQDVVEVQVVREHPFPERRARHEVLTRVAAVPRESHKIHARLLVDAALPRSSRVSCPATAWSGAGRRDRGGASSSVAAGVEITRGDGVAGVVRGAGVAEGAAAARFLGWPFARASVKLVARALLRRFFDLHASRT